jgi:hypothetical protein
MINLQDGSESLRECTALNLAHGEDADADGTSMCRCFRWREQ